MPFQEWYATQNVCPHKRALVLSQGIVGSKNDVVKVTCPLHKKNFDLSRFDMSRWLHQNEDVFLVSEFLPISNFGAIVGVSCDARMLFFIIMVSYPRFPNPLRCSSIQNLCCMPVSLLQHPSGEWLDHMDDEDMKLMIFPVKVEHGDVYLELPPVAELDQVTASSCTKEVVVSLTIVIVLEYGCPHLHGPAPRYNTRCTIRPLFLPPHHVIFRCSLLCVVRRS